MEREELLRFIGGRVGRLRSQTGVSEQQMSRELGMGKTYINQIENGKSLPSMEAFVDICAYVGVTPGEFFADGVEHPRLIHEMMDEARKMSEADIMSVLTLMKSINKK